MSKFGALKASWSRPSKVSHGQASDHQEQKAFSTQELGYKLGSGERIFLSRLQISTHLECRKHDKKF